MERLIKEYLDTGEELFAAGYFDEAEFFFGRVLARSVSRSDQAVAADRLREICEAVRREDDAERFGQLARDFRGVCYEKDRTGIRN